MDEATEKLERYIPALRRYAWALVRDGDAADDLVQDCLERALSRWWLRPRSVDLAPWLFTILRHLHVDRHRASRRRGVHVALDEAEGAGVTGDQEDGLTLRDTLAALDRLPEEQKSLLLLVGVEDLSYEEAARVLGVPVGTVMSRLSRGRARLRSLLEAGRVTLLRSVK